MKIKILLTASLLLFSICSSCQKGNSINVNIEKLRMHWQFKGVNDTLVMKDYDDTLSVMANLLDNSGSYMLTLINNKTSSKEVFCYKGNKNKYNKVKVAVFDVEGRLIKYLYKKIYNPSLLANCN